MASSSFPATWRVSQWLCVHLHFPAGMPALHSTFGSMTSLYPHLSGSCTFSTEQDGCQQGALAQAVRPVTARTAIPPHVPTVPSYNRQTTNCALTRSKSKRMNSSPDTSVKNKVR